MSAPQLFTPPPLAITEAAIAKIQALVEEEGNPELKLRVFVTGGGCSGFQYGFAFEEQAAEDDTRVERDGVTVVVDPLSPVFRAQSQCFHYLWVRFLVLHLNTADQPPLRPG